jgi:beta-glucanase (GH16 family)
LLAAVTLIAVGTAASSAPASGALAPYTPATVSAEREIDHARSGARRVPAPIAGRGYRVVFRDGFDRFRRRVWTRSIWYEPPAAAGDIFTRNGVLHLVSRRGHEYPNVSVTTLKSRSFRRGYFEARMRWTRGNGAWPAFWLFSSRHAKNSAWPSINPYCQRHGLPDALCWAAELDIFEGQGTEPRTFYGTLHRNTNGAYGVDDATNPNAWPSVKPNLTRAFHVYSALWTRKWIRWYLDGREVIRWPIYRSTNQPMFIILDMWTGGWTLPVDSTTPRKLQLEVDYVRVWRP